MRFGIGLLARGMESL